MTPMPTSARCCVTRPSTRTGRAAALTVYFQFVELRHKIELHNLTGRVIECPLDEMNRPRASAGLQLRVPPAERRWSSCSPGGVRSWQHVHGTHVEDAWAAGQQRAADRWKGLAR
jgi:hypothetical protein